MRPWGALQVLNAREEEAILGAALRILEEVGVQVEDARLLEHLAAFGARVDAAAARARFGRAFMERFIADAAPFDGDAVEPNVAGCASVYHGYYLDPDSGEHLPWTLPRVFAYLKIAHHLPHARPALGLPFPLPEVPSEASLLFFHYLALKFHGRCGPTVDHVADAPHVLAMAEAASDALGRPLAEVLRPSVYMSPPLRLGREEAGVFEYFAERGVRVNIGHMTAAGAAGPATLAGALALHLAEGLFIAAVNRARFGERTLALGCSVAPLDMRTGMYPYGRPEMELCNVAMAQLARRLRASFAGHGGHSDAKRPGAEAGFQKALTTLPTLMACGRAAVCCGLLSVDEVFSPVQMVIDDEIVGALQRFARGFEVNDDTLALDLIAEVGPGGTFLDTEHTARRFRGEFWEPRLFARDMLAGWLRNGGRTEADIARDVVHDLAGREPLPPQIGSALEGRLLDLIRRATGARLRPAEAR